MPGQEAELVTRLREMLGAAPAVLRATGTAGAAVRRGPARRAPNDAEGCGPV